MRAPYATACVLSYNRPHLLERQIGSLRANAGYPVEVVIHDDGSSDPAVSGLLNSWVDSGFVSTIFRSPPGWNQGQGTALNRMFRLATGDPILKMDQDVVLRPNWLRRTIDILEKTPLEGVLWPVFQHGKVVAHTLIDEDVVPLIEPYVWRLGPKNTVMRTNGGHRMTMLHYTIATAKGLIPEHKPKYDVDHINRVKLDNRLTNLRYVRKRENAQNKSAIGGSSKYRGVSWNTARRSWAAVVRLDDKLHNVGMFDDEREAAEAAEQFRRERMPFATPDPLLFDEHPPPIGLLGLYRYHAEPVDCAKTIIGRGDGWERHSHICGCAFAMTRDAWEAMGSFSEHSAAFSEDFEAQKWIHESGLWCCALPEENIADNDSFGIGPSTVVVDHGTVAKIHTEPHILGA